LITGEPGAGKTWQARRLAAVLPDGWQTAFVDLATGMNGLDFLQWIGHALGISVPNRLGAARLSVHGALTDESNDGRRWLLVVDEAHRGNSSVWDEIQAIINQLGRRGGFAALVVLGQTELARALSTRSLSGFASHISLHLHLMPLDLDEARDLLGYPGGAAVSFEHALEELHRDSGGNPGKLLRLAHARLNLPELNSDRKERLPLHDQNRLPEASLTRREDAPQFADDERVRASTKPEARTPTARPDTSPLIPTKPPLRDEDGLVEVGWEGDLETEFRRGGVPTGAELPSADDPTFNEELIEDRYTALQAWAEWTRNQQRSAGECAAYEPAQPAPAVPQATSGAMPTDPAELGNPVDSRHSGDSTSQPDPTDSADPAAEADAARSPAVAVPPAGFRAESQHEFAPYSHLFTRLRAKG
jgi:general secretion pathway protein A